MTPLIFEEVYDSEIFSGAVPGTEAYTSRAQVEGGWIYRTKYWNGEGHSISQVFVADN